MKTTLVEIHRNATQINLSQKGKGSERRGRRREREVHGRIWFRAQVEIIL